MKISKFTLGTAQLGLSYGIANSKGLLTDQDAQRLLEYAWANEIKSFDTAPAYGESEKRLGIFFKSNNITHEHENFCITTKVAAHQDTASRSELFSFIQSSIKRSLFLMNLEKIHICLLHKTKDMYDENVRDCLEKIKEDGLVQKFGVSVYTPKEVEDFLALDSFDAIQIPINIFDQRLIHSGLLKKLNNQKKIVFARSAFLQGLFFLDPHALPAYVSSAKPYLHDLIEISNEFGIPINELAIRFLTSLNQITSILLGMETIEQIDENRKIFDKPELPQKIMNIILEKFKGVPEEIINPSLWKKS